MLYSEIGWTKMRIGSRRVGSGEGFHSVQDLKGILTRVCFVMSKGTDGCCPEVVRESGMAAVGR